VNINMEISLEVVEHVHGISVFKTPLVGSSKLMPIEFLAPEVLMTNKAELTKTKGKKGTKKYQEQSTGLVHLIMYLSESPETIGRPPENQYFYYEPYKFKLKTGDLILYSEIGLLATMCKLSRNSIHSRAGIVMKMPNKYTKNEELFVFEVTRNSEGYADAWNEKSRSGLNIFRLWERIHHVPGHDVFWCPLKEPLQGDMTENMIDWIHKVHDGKIDLSSYFQPIPKVCKDLLLTFGLDIEKDKSHQIREDLKEFQSTDVIVEALRIGGLRVPNGEVYAEDLIHLEAYDDPVQFRAPMKLPGRKEMVWPDREAIKKKC